MHQTWADPVILLNNKLQGSSEGNVAPQLIWELTQQGPNNRAVHTAIAKCKPNIVQ